PETLVWHCPVCGAGGGWRDLAEKLGIPLPRSPKQVNGSHAASPVVHDTKKTSAITTPSVGLTLDEYSQAKQLPIAFLKSLGMQNDPSGQPQLWIPYKNPDGSVFRVQIRRRMDKADGVDDRFSWGAGDGQILYGLEDCDE